MHEGIITLQNLNYICRVRRGQGGERGKVVKVKEVQGGLVSRTMLIEKHDELESWVTSHLEPLCAHPAALSKYVVALIMKDKSMA